MLSCHSSTLAYSVLQWTIEDFGNLHLNTRTIHDLDITDLSYYRGRPKDFIGLQQCWFPEYYEIALEDRVEVAANIVKMNTWSSDVFRLALSRNCIPNLAVHVRDSGGQTLLHTVAWAIGYIQAEPADCKSNEGYATALEGT